MTKILPQLAVDTAPDFKGMRFPVWGFRKIDGVRACHITGKFTGRSLEDMKNTALVEMFSGPQYVGFDGELTINGCLRTNELPIELTPDNETLCGLTTGITNRAKLRKGEDELPTNVVWNLFDYLHPDVLHLPYAERHAALVKKVMPESVLDLDTCNVRVLGATVIENVEAAQAFIEECLELGYEGAIFRDPTALHKSGRATARGNDFWRFKPTSDKDCIITGFEEALENQNEAKTNALGRTERSSHQGNLVGKGMIGTVLATDVETGKPIRLGPGSMTHKQRTDWFNNPDEIVGWAAKYTSLDYGTKDAPRQARFKERRAKSDLAVRGAA
jgi:DNA ligase-1